jgi:hypothetical protein
MPERASPAIAARYQDRLSDIAGLVCRGRF